MPYPHKRILWREQVLQKKNKRTMRLFCMVRFCLCTL